MDTRTVATVVRHASTSAYSVATAPLTLIIGLYEYHKALAMAWMRWFLSVGRAMMSYTRGTRR